MISYKDMTFCSYWDECKDGKICFRRLTTKVWNDAQKAHLPICQYAGRPECLRKIENED